MSEEKRLMKGNEAIAEAALRAGCGAYFGYPITPQNELIAYMAANMIPRKLVFIQAESEVSAINMCFGASAAGLRAMTSSSSPGISLKQEGISYAAGADIPVVIANIQRAGPGLGGISPSQADYFQSTRGGGHGDYYTPVLAPWSVQEAADLTYLAFDLADRYRTPVLLLGDGLLGQMMEAVSLPPQKKQDDRSSWAVGSQYKTHRENRHLTSINLVPAELEAKNIERFKRYDEIKRKETRYEEIECADAELILVAYGTSARVSLGAVQLARKEGIKLGLLRPIALWPFPDEPILAHAMKGRGFLCVEMSQGQMVQDVLLAVKGKVDVALVGRSGGVIPTEEEVFEKAKALLKARKG